MFYVIVLNFMEIDHTVAEIFFRVFQVKCKTIHKMIVLNMACFWTNNFVKVRYN